MIVDALTSVQLMFDCLLSSLPIGAPAAESILSSNEHHTVQGYQLIPDALLKGTVFRVGAVSHILV